MIRRLRESNRKYLKERYGKQPTLKELCKILASIGFEGSFDLVDYNRDGTVGTVDISDGVYDIFDFEYGGSGELPDMPVYYIEQNNQGGITMAELR